MDEKTFTLNINGYEYEMPYWTFPWIVYAVNTLQEGGVPLNLRTARFPSLWIKPEYDVQFVFPDPADPEIPERLTEKERHHAVDLFNGDSMYGYRVLDVSMDDGEPIFFEWDDPKLNQRSSAGSKPE
ncbi:hypothetical protein ACDL40_09900 [Corynebacterium diphtheriae]|uniref:hypothetical protein n=1 Tax=Corynebacterium diphtheriae TaxID=1717 RepID=UPI003530F2F0